MSRMTIEDLTRILVECAGAADAVEAGKDLHDLEFEELGYDSLALMETAARTKVEFGVDLPDDVVAELHTPRAYLDTVNKNIGETV